MNRVFSFVFKAMIVAYQHLISPLTTAQCRYNPTCSQYGLEAIQKYGAWKGVVLIIQRIFKCHPWGGQGNDPLL